MRKFWNWVKNEDGRTLYFDGYIAQDSWFDDDITPKKFKAELLRDTGDIAVWLNSPGGDVFAASQIYTMLREYPGKVTVKIDGIAASAASVIAMAGDEVVMSPVAMMMMAMTHAKTGRSRKNLDSIAPLRQFALAAGGVAFACSSLFLSGLTSKGTAFTETPGLTF